MRWTYLLITSCILGCCSAGAQSLRDTGIFAIVGVKIEVGDGKVIDKGTVLLRNGIIEAVGKEIVVPVDAVVIKGDGLVVYPGFIDANSTVGLQLPAWQPNQDTPPETNSIAPPFMRDANRKGVRPELRAVDCLAMPDATVSPMRQLGFTSAFLMPSGGTINGTGALVNLSGAPKRDCLVRSDIAMGMAFVTSGGGGFSPASLTDDTPLGTGYPGSLLGVTALLRQTLYDARYYQTVKANFENGGGQRPPGDECLSALQTVITGKLPVVFDATSQNEIVRASRIADEFGLKLIVSGGNEAWKQSDLLAKKHIPVLVSLNYGNEPGVRPTGGFGGGGGRPGGFGGGGGGRPGGVGGGAGRRNRTPGAPQGQPPVNGQPALPTAPPANANFPNIPATPEEDDTPKSVIAEQHQKWEESTGNAAQLQKSGVLFAFTTSGGRGQSDFWKNLRKAITSGLPREAALQALTINPAKIFGVDRQLGTVETGKIANLVIMSGDFADARSRVRYVFIDKNKFDIEAEQPTRTAPIIPAPVEEDAVDHE